MNEPINPGQPWEVYRARLESIKEKLKRCKELHREVARQINDPITPRYAWDAHEVYLLRLESIKDELKRCKELHRKVVRDSCDSNALTDQKRWTAHGLLWKLTDVIATLESMLCDSCDSTLTDQKRWAADAVLWQLTDVITRLEYMQ